MLRILATLAVLLATSLGVAAQDSLPDTEAGRYILRPVDDGLMRVDRETGATSFCRKRETAWVCEAVADDRVVLEDEIARLSQDNSELARKIGRLQQRIARLEAGGPKSDARPAPESQKKGKSDKERPGLGLPDDKDIDQVVKTFESMMRRFLDMVRDLRDDYEKDRT